METEKSMNDDLQNFLDAKIRFEESERKIKRIKEYTFEEWMANGKKMIIDGKEL